MNPFRRNKTPFYNPLKRLYSISEMRDMQQVFQGSLWLLEPGYNARLNIFRGSGTITLKNWFHGHGPVKVTRMRCYKSYHSVDILIVHPLFLAFLLLTACSGTIERAETTPLKRESDSITASDQGVRLPANEIALSAISPWFTHINGGRAAQALADNNLTEAVALFDEMIPGLADENLKSRARFLAAYIAFYTGDAKRAFEELPPMVATLPLLTEVIHEVTALAAFRLERFDDCIAIAQKIETTNLVAAMVLGDAYQKMGRLDDALMQYRKVQKKWPGDAKAESQAKMVACIAQMTEEYRLDDDAHPVSTAETSPLSSTTDAMSANPEKTGVMLGAYAMGLEPIDVGAADVSGDRGKITVNATPADRNAYFRMLIEEALTLIDSMSAQTPQGHWTREACAFEDLLLERVGRTVSAARKENRVAQNLFEDAHELMLKRRYDKAQKAYVKTIKFARRGGALECRARYEQALVTSFLREHQEAATEFEAVASDCSEPDIRLKALYKAGKSNMSASQYEKAIEMFSEVEKQFRAHSYADDARLYTAKSYLALGNEKKFLELITSLPQDYPSGDMRAEALWLGASRSLEQNQLTEARDILAKYFEMFPIEKGWYTAGRAAYWLGRVEELLGNRETAIRQYEHVITTTPFTFYMVLAYSRFEALDEIGAKILMAELTPESGKRRNSIPRKLLESGPFAIGVELVRLGLVSRGTRLIKSLLRKSTTPPSVHRAAAALFRRVGSFADSREITDSFSDGWQSRYPAGADFDSWTLAFPLAFESEVGFAAAESGVDRMLILAIMREESGFNTSIESWANAMGLMQLILPTARAVGAGLGIQVNRKSLRDPRINIRLGAAYLKSLGESFGNNPALMVPGYNAGGGAVSRWLKERGEMPLDLFVETIPFSQTRGYTKRVLATWATYRFLYEPGRPFTALEYDLRK